MTRSETGQADAAGGADASSADTTTQTATEITTETKADAEAKSQPPVETVCVIINPRAGGWRRVPAAAMQPTLEATVTEWLLCHARYAPEQITTHLLREAGGGAKLTRAALDAGCRTIVAVGGDGTFNDVLQGMMASGQDDVITLGLIPMGTANVLAGVLNLPVGDPAHAARIICEGHARRIDVGQTQSRWFALVAGVGFDAAATQRVNARLKRHLGELAYIGAAAGVALRYPRQPVRVTCNGGRTQTFDAYLVVIANGGQWGGRYRLGADVRLDDGLLDVYVCERRGVLALSVLRHGLALMRNRFESVAGVQHFRVREVMVEADVPLPVQLDGDAAGATPLHVRVVPNALRVFVPKDSN